MLLSFFFISLIQEYWEMHPQDLTKQTAATATATATAVQVGIINGDTHRL